MLEIEPPADGGRRRFFGALWLGIRSSGHRPLGVENARSDDEQEEQPQHDPADTHVDIMESVC